MEFDVYCDESYPDLFTSNNPKGFYLVIGGVWVRRESRAEFKREIHLLRDTHRIGGEFKWIKVSPSKLAFYIDLINWFFDKQDEIIFRCIAVRHDQVDLIKYHESDAELGFYKFYYQMLHHWITDFNNYSIFCDYKSNRSRNRLHILKKCLIHSNISSRIENVQAIRSKESVLIQLVDVLTGIASASLNRSIRKGSAKSKLVDEVEKRLSRKIGHTVRDEKKFNVFVINLQGGW
jgi:hypothetical protein